MAQLQQMWAKVGARERLVAYGAVAVLVGWLLGQILATKNLCAGFAACNLNYFGAGNAGLFAILALLLAIVAAVALYLRFAPNVNFTWPVPYVQALLGIAVATFACTVLTLLFQVTNSIGDAPVTMWIADIVFVGGGAVMAWGAYQEWTLNKPPAA